MWRRQPQRIEFPNLFLYSWPCAFPGAEENTTRWQQPGVAPSAEAGPSREGGGRKRGADDLAEDDDDMPEDVKRRLAMLQGKA
eukprot:1160098-Pelagomonas_calceolata.AAC.2